MELLHVKIPTGFSHGRRVFLSFAETEISQTLTLIHEKYTSIDCLTVGCLKMQDKCNPLKRMRMYLIPMISQILNNNRKSFSTNINSMMKKADRVIVHEKLKKIQLRYSILKSSHSKPCINTGGKSTFNTFLLHSQNKRTVSAPPHDVLFTPRLFNFSTV